MRLSRTFLFAAILVSTLLLASCNSQTSAAGLPAIIQIPTNTPIAAITATTMPTPVVVMAPDAFRNKQQVTIPSKTPSGATFVPQNLAPNGSFVVGSAATDNQSPQVNFDIVLYTFSTKTFAILHQLKKQFWPQVVTDGQYVAWMNPAIFTGGPSDGIGSEVGYENLATGNIVILASTSEGLVAASNGEFALTHGKLLWGKIDATFQQQPLVMTDLASNTTTILNTSLSARSLNRIQADWPYIGIDVAQPTPNSYLFINLQTQQQHIVDEPGAVLLFGGMLYIPTPNNTFNVVPNPVSQSTTPPILLDVPPYFDMQGFQATNGHIFIGDMNYIPTLWDRDTGQIIGLPDKNSYFQLQDSFLIFGSTQTGYIFVRL